MKQGTYKRTEATLKRMRESHIGNAGWNKGVPRSEETKRKISKTNKRLGIHPPSQLGTKGAKSSKLFK